MPRCIDADALFKTVNRKFYSAFEVGSKDSENGRFRRGYNVAITDACEAITAAPTISPDEVRGVGEWIMLENQSKEDTDNGNYWYTCSHCSAGDLHAKVQEVPFCWRCGARMKGVSEDA